MRIAKLGINRRGLGELLFLIKMLGLEQLRLIGAFRRGIRAHVGVDLVEQRRRVGIVEIDQPLVLRVFRFLLARIFVDELPVNFVGFLRMPELTMTVPDDQHHLGAHFFRNLFSAALVFCNDLVVGARLILEPQQPDLRDRAPFSGFRQRPAFLQ